MIILEGLRMQQAKVDTLQKILALVDVPRFRVFLGLANYHYQSVKYFSLIVQPLIILTGKDLGLGCGSNA